MRGEAFRGRDKKVQKLGRDGLVERNQATGEERRISGRTADISFDRRQAPDQTAGRNHGQKPSKKKRQKVQVPELLRPPEEKDTFDSQESPEAAPEMRGAVDLPMLVPPPELRSEAEHPRKNRRNSGKRRIFDQRDGSWLRKKSAAAVPESPKFGKQRRTTWPSIAPEAKDTPMRSPPLPSPDAPPENPTIETGGRLCFEEEKDSTKPGSPPLQHPKRKSTQAKQKRTRLRFDDEPASLESRPPAKPSDVLGNAEESTVPDVSAGTTAPSRRQRKQYEKSERRVEQTSRKLDKAQSKLPVKRRIYLEKKYNSSSGKVRRMWFEKEARPEHEKPSLPLRAGRFMKTAAVMKLHNKLHESERENTALEAAHKSELAAEQGIGRFLSWNRSRLCSKPYRAVRRAERKSTLAQADLAWRTALREQPGLRRQSVLKKWRQRQAMRKRYVQMAREKNRALHFPLNLAAKAGNILRAAVQSIPAQRTVLPFLAAAVLVVTLFLTGLTSCTAVFSGLQSGYLSETYLANEKDICQSDLYFTELETDLQLNIDSTEANFPSYYFCSKR